MNKATVYARRDVGEVILEILSRYNVELEVPKCCASLYTVFNGFGPELCLQYCDRLAGIVLASDTLKKYPHHERISKRFIELLIRKAVRNCLLDKPISVSYTLSPTPEKESSDAVETWELPSDNLAEHSERNASRETAEPSDSDSNVESWYEEASTDESEEG